MIGILKDALDRYILVVVLMVAMLACLAAEPLLALAVWGYCRIRGIKV